MDLIHRIQMWFRAQPPALRTILVANIAIYLLYQLVFAYIDPVANFIHEHLALNTDLPGILFEPWQLITYSFLHTGPGWNGLFHVLFNMWLLVIVGREFEFSYGSHRFIAVYLFSVLAGGLLCVILHALFPNASIFSGGVVGASGGVYGVLMAVATFQPQKTIGLLLLGSVRLLHLILGLLFLDILFLRTGARQSPPTGEVSWPG